MGKTILDALNELVEKQGGTTEDNKLIVDAINDLVNTSGGGSSGSSVLIAEETRVEHGSAVEITLDKTWKEIHDAFISGTVVLLKNGDDYETVNFVNVVDPGEGEAVTYEVGTNSQYGNNYFSTQTENGYPQYVG